MKLAFTPPTVKKKRGTYHRSGKKEIFGKWVEAAAFQMVLVVKNLPASAGDIRDASLIPGSGRFPWRRALQPTPVFLPGESHGQRSLAGYSP